MPYSGTIVSEQYPATDETQCLSILIPAGDEFKALAYGLLNKATLPNSYDDPDSAQTEGLCAVWDNALYLTDWNACMENTQSANNSLFLTAGDFDVDSGGANTFVGASGQPMGGYWWQTSFAPGDAIDCYRYMVAGDWTLRFMCQRGAAGGKFLPQVIDVDGNINVLTEVDLYLATSQAAYSVDRSFTLSVSGLARIYIGNNSNVAGRNRIPLSYVSMWRTG